MPPFSSKERPKPSKKKKIGEGGVEGPSSVCFYCKQGGVGTRFIPSSRGSDMYTRVYESHKNRDGKGLCEGSGEKVIDPNAKNALNRTTKPRRR